jgi:hypothetical protein
VFLKRGKKETCVSSRKVPDGVPLAGHLGELWHILQGIASEEDPRFAERSVVEHFNDSAEGQWDVTRWLNMYQRRLDPRHPFAFPARAQRHRGYVLLERNWPDGLAWDAFDATTWARVPLERARDRDSLARALDAWIDGARAGGASRSGPSPPAGPPP